MKKSKLKYLFYLQIIILAYFLLTTVMFFLSIKQGNEGVTFELFGGGGDGVFYWEQAKNVAIGDSWVRTSIYPLIIGNLIKITGINNVFLIRVFNYFGFLLLIFFSMLLVKTQFKTNSSIIDEKYIYKAKILLIITFMFYVSLQMNINISIFRDVWIYTLYVLATYLSIELIFHKNRGIILFVTFLFSLWLLGEFRRYTIISFLLSLAIYFIYNKLRLLRDPKKYIIVVVFLFALYYSLFIDLTIFGMSLRQALNFRSVSLDYYAGGSQMGISLDQSNILLFLINYLYSYLGNWIGPFPWHISGMSTLVVFIFETIPMIFILKYLWSKRHYFTEVQKYIFTHGLVWISLIGFTNDNLGTATRLRPVAWILILIVLVVIYSKDVFAQTKKERK